VSIGVNELLRTATDFLRYMSGSDMEEYRNKGCDIHLALCDDFRQVFSNAELYYVRLNSENTPDDYFKSSHTRYLAENATRVIRAFVSIAEYERFKGGFMYSYEPYMRHGTKMKMLMGLYKEKQRRKTYLDSYKDFPGCIDPTPEAQDLGELFGPIIEPKPREPKWQVYFHDRRLRNN
jgi:hypothetical protein